MKHESSHARHFLAELHEIAMAELSHSAYDLLLAELDQVLTEWRAIIEPELISRVAPARLLDSLPEILPRLLIRARSGAVEINDELKQRIAVDHGFARREDVVPVEQLAEEWEALKQACQRVLARHGFVGPLAEEATRRIDVLIDDAIGYTLRGYYQRELDTLRGRGLERRDQRDDDRRQGSDRRDSNNESERHEIEP
jgi:hypothetical protein